jgi:hypothetical protein
VQQGKGLLNRGMDYAEAARILGPFYKRELSPRNPAKHRITKLLQLSTLLGTEGVLQIDVCPFHSPTMPKKLALIRESAQHGLLARYVEAVQGYIAAQSVVVVLAVGTQKSLRSEMKVSPWLAWLTTITGLDLKNASFVRLVSRDAKTTCGAFVSSGSRVMKWFEKSAAHGNPGGCTSIGTMYATGNGVSQDGVKAVALFHKGLEHGDRNALQFFATRRIRN